MSNPLLTDRSVHGIKPPATGRVEYPDAKVPGLRLRVSSSGKKVWIVRARSKEKVVTRTLGRYPTMGLGAARTEAATVLEAISEGATDVLDRTFDELVTAWVEGHAKVRNKSWQSQERRLQAHASPALGDKKVRAIRRAEIRELIAGIDGDVLPNRVLTVLKTVFRWALENDWVEVDPTAGIRKPKVDASRDRVLSMEEIAAVWKASEWLGYPFREYVRILLLTGQRRSEIATAQWDWINLDDATMTLPASTTKNGRAHLVPLSPQAVAILEAMPKFGEAGFVFTSNGTSPISGFTKLKTKLDRFLADEVDDWVFHDLRRSFATHAVRLGVLEEVVGKVLNHTSTGVTSRVYALHRYEAEKREALTRWAAEVDRALNGEKVVKLRPAS